MTEDDNDTSESPLTLIGDAVALANGLPPGPSRNLLKAFSRLVSGLVDIPAAKLEEVAADIRYKGELKRRARGALAEKAIDLGTADEALVERTLHATLHRDLREQKNVESIFQRAMKALGSPKPSADSAPEDPEEPPAPIDDDWLDHFRRVASLKSNRDVQEHMARLLANEIGRPGSISLQTIHTLATLSTEAAAIFQTFCDHTLSIPWLEPHRPPFLLAEPFGHPGSNALAQFNLNFTNLSVLIDERLIKPDLSTWLDLPSLFFSRGQVYVGSKELGIDPDRIDTSKTKSKSQVILLTQTGLEIRRCLALGTSHPMSARIEEWIAESFYIVNQN